MLDQSINLHAGIPRIAVLYLYPQDVVEFHRQARTAGLPVPDLDETFYGMTEFLVDDTDGNRLWIGHTRGSSGGASTCVHDTNSLLLPEHGGSSLQLSSKRNSVR